MEFTNQFKKIMKYAFIGYSGQNTGEKIIDYNGSERQLHYRTYQNVYTSTFLPHFDSNIQTARGVTGVCLSTDVLDSNTTVANVPSYSVVSQTSSNTERSCTLNCVVKNTGSETFTINSVYFNGNFYYSVNSPIAYISAYHNLETPVTIAPNQTATIEITTTNTVEWD